MPEKLTPSNLAKKLDISANTVRRITSTYADFLSEGATPPAGGRRIYTLEDAATIEMIHNMQNLGKDEAEILDQLEHGITLPPDPSDAATEVSNPLSLSGQPNTFPAISIDIEPITAAIDRQTVAQAAAQAEVIAAMERLANTREQDLASREKLIHAANLIFAGILALCLIMLLTLAVAVGWIG